MAVIGLEEARQYLKVDTTDDDALICSLIIVAEAAVEKLTGRKLLTTDFTYTLDIPPDPILIPYSPLQEITKIETVALDGAISVVDPEIYVVDTSQDQMGRIWLKPDCSWPAHRGFASFIITGKAGYGETPDKVPEPLKHAILIAVGTMYEQRGILDVNELVGRSLMETLNTLCWPYRVMRI